MEQSLQLETTRPVRSKLRWLLPLAALPALVPIWAIWVYAVNIPTADEWKPSIAGLFIKAHAGTLSFWDFWAPLNEHRIVIPKVVIFALGWMTHWNASAEMMFGWLCCACTSVLLLRLMVLTSNGLTTAVAARWFVCNIMLFSMSQYENFLSGFGLVNLLPTTILLIAVVIVLSKWRLSIRVGLAALLAIAATFSLGNGLLAWGVVGIIIAWSDSIRTIKSRIPVMVIWAVFCVACVVILLSQFARPPSAPAAATLGGTIHHFFVFLGNHFAYVITSSKFALEKATGMAVLMLLMLLGCIIYFVFAFIRRDDELCRRMIVWLAIASYAVLSAFLASLSRAGFGPIQALASRYVSFSNYAPIALISLLPMVADDILRRHGTSLGIFARGTIRYSPTVLGTLLVIVTLQGISPAKGECYYNNVMRRMGKGALLMAALVPGEPKLPQLVNDDPKTLVEEAIALNEIGLIQPPMILNRDITAIADPVPAGEEYGNIDQVGQSAENELMMFGWAILPYKSTPADAVIFTNEGPDGQPMIIASAQMGFARDDIRNRFGVKSYGASGFKLTVRISSISPDMKDVKLRAWALDVTTGRAFKLNGEVPLAFK